MSRGPAVLIASLVVLLAPVSAVPASAEAVDQRYPMPKSGAVTIKGHGFGHGHGMSQYGAEGAARQGRSWQQIVGFYYPGLQLREARRRVRVLISADTSRDVVVSPRPGLVVRDLAAGRTLRLDGDAAARQWRLEVNRHGDTVLDRLGRSRWRRKQVFEGDAYFNAAGNPITLHLGSTTRQYRGRLLAARPAPGSKDRDTVNAVGLDHYIKGVIPHEMPVSWRPAAVRSQAVAARTYAAYERAHPRADHYQLCDTTSCQVYGGYSAEDPRSNDAVRATSRMILATDDNAPAFTQFSASSGGWTAANRFPYLPAKRDPYDGWAGNAVHDWSVKVDVARIERAFPAVGDLRRIVVTSRDGNGQWQGRVWSMRLEGGKGRATVSGDTFRSRLGLRSTWFSFG